MSVSREVYEALTAQVHTLTAERDQLRARVAELETLLTAMAMHEGTPMSAATAEAFAWQAREALDK